MVKITAKYKPSGEPAIDENETKKLKREVSRKASMANKRLQRLEKNGLQNLPAYSHWVEYGGGVKFGVKGKNYNELEKELARVNQFIDAKTSTVRGANRVLKDIASTAGIKYTTSSELLGKTNNFFTLASQVEQYMGATNNAGQAIGYQKLWQVINDYVEKENIDLQAGFDDVYNSVDEIAEIMAHEYVNDVMADFEEDMKNLF